MAELEVEGGGLDQATHSEALFAGPGEMRALCRALDWSSTPLGAVEGWPTALRTAMRLMLESPVATSLWCGPSYTLVYNDVYRPILGVKVPLISIDAMTASAPSNVAVALDRMGLRFR